MNKRQAMEEAGTAITKVLADQGKLIEAGFALFKHYVISKDASQTQVDEMRFAFMAGAEYLFSSIMCTMDKGTEPTPADLKRMSLIDKEIEMWRAIISERITPAQGNA